jgi:hypothetical protein
VPRDTGTGVAVNEKGREVRKPLGGWEDKDAPRGLFFARPGIYFPLEPTDADLKEVKARGLGYKAILKHWQKICASWEKHGVWKKVQVDEISRFCGAKTSIHRSRKGYSRANAADGIKPCYGQWIARPVEMDFSPLPKRQGLNRDGFTLALRSFPGERSAAYDRAVARMLVTNQELEQAETELLEQPDGGLVDAY